MELNGTPGKGNSQLIVVKNSNKRVIIKLESENSKSF
jgi:hypothetical protein